MKRLFIGLFAAMLLSACGGSPDAPATPAASPDTMAPTASPTTATGGVPEALSPGTDWILVGPNTADVRLAGRGVTLRFGDDGTLSGSAPINSYSGPFTAGEDGSIEIGSVTRTEMGAEPDLMAAESQYFEALALVDGFDADGEQLWLRTGDQPILRYGLEDSAAVFGASLVGKPVAKARKAAGSQGYEWRVVSVDGEGRPVTMDYRTDRLNATVVDGRVVEVTVG